VEGSKMVRKGTARLVKPRAKGQVTIPSDFREKLGIDENTILRMELRGKRIEITPLQVADEDLLLRKYDSGEIDAFLQEDKIDPETARKVRELLGG
jgi:AbrB family looped-hinge helix DNA binding protein